MRGRNWIPRGRSCVQAGGYETERLSKCEGAACCDPDFGGVLREISQESFGLLDLVDEDVNRNWRRKVLLEIDKERKAEALRMMGSSISSKRRS